MSKATKQSSDSEVEQEQIELGSFEIKSKLPGIHSLKISLQRKGKMKFYTCLFHLLMVRYDGSKMNSKVEHQLQKYFKIHAIHIF